MRTLRYNGIVLQIQLLLHLPPHPGHALQAVGHMNTPATMATVFTSGTYAMRLMTVETTQMSGIAVGFEYLLSVT